MTWQSVKIEAQEKDAERMSDALLELGALSVTLEDAEAGTSREQAIFGEPGEAADVIWQRSVVSALFEPDQDIAHIVCAAAQAAGLNQAPRYCVEILAEQDWVRLTQAQFDPIEISSRLWIVPTWHVAPNTSAINLILDPGLAFGTGSHPTTRLCLQWLDQHICGGEQMLDYGCGSGILAIAALKLGAARAFGIDIDPQAITASHANAAQNQSTAEFYLPHAAPNIQVDVVVANILTNPLKVLAPLLCGSVRSGGQIVLSGILEQQADAVCAVYQNWCDMRIAAADQGWVCLSGYKR